MEIPFLSRDSVNDYIRTEFTSVPDIVLQFEQQARTIPIPPHHITPEIGKVLEIFARLVQAKRILEIGTMWGYSTWWLSQGLAEGGKIITLEKELKHFNLAQQFFAATDTYKQIELRHCDALEELSTFDADSFDMVFLDADKREYPRLLALLTPLIRPGGVFITDNVIYSSNWHNTTVADKTDDERIQRAQQFNAQLAHGSDFVAVPIAIRSGIMVATKL